MSTKLQKQQVGWMRAHVIAPASDGHAVAKEDLDALPEDVRAQTLTLAQHTKSMYDAGERQRAREFANEELASLALDLGDWQPPRDRPDAEVLDQIARR